MDSDYQFYQRLNICPQCKNVALFGQEKLCPECRAYFANRMSRQREINNDRIKQIKNESYRRIADYRNTNNLCTKCGSLEQMVIKCVRIVGQKILEYVEKKEIQRKIKRSTD